MQQRHINITHFELVYHSLRAYTSLTSSLYITHFELIYHSLRAYLSLTSSLFITHFELIYHSLRAYLSLTSSLYITHFELVYHSLRACISLTSSFLESIMDDFNERRRIDRGFSKVRPIKVLRRCYNDILLSKSLKNQSIN